ncbi:MAG: tyrosine-type recombinase/integrase [Pseudomonadota bacterium]
MPLKIYRRGNGIYHVRGTFLGVKIDRSAQTRERKIAEAERARIEHDIQREGQFGAQAVACFADAASRYLKAGGEARFIIPLIEHMGEEPLAKIDQARADDAAAILLPDAAPATINRQIITPIRAILNRAAEDGLCAPPRLRARKVAKHDGRWLRVEEADALIAAATPHIRPLMTFMLATGVRASEALALLWSDVDLAHGHARIRKAKAQRGRSVVFGRRAVAALSTLTHRDSVVFLNARGAPYTVPAGASAGSPLRKTFTTASRRARLAEPATPHMLRHTWATWAMATTKDLLFVQEHGGWTDANMVRTYTHLAPRSYGERVLAHGWEPYGIADLPGEISQQNQEHRNG